MAKSPGSGMGRPVKGSSQSNSGKAKPPSYGKGGKGGKRK